MLSDKRVEELVDEISCFFEYNPGGLPSPRLRTPEAIVRTAATEAMAANDKAWQWQLSNPNSDAHMMKGAHVRLAIREAVAAERKACAGLVEDEEGWEWAYHTGDDPPFPMGRISYSTRHNIAAAVRARGEEEQ